MFEKIVEPIDATKYELFLLIHNAGSIGNLDHLAADMNDPDEWNKYVQTFIRFDSLLTLLLQHLNCTIILCRIRILFNYLLIQTNTFSRIKLYF